MGVKSVKATINGQVVNLTYNSSTGYWEASANAPSNSSWSQTNHKYGISITAEDDAGNTTSIDRGDGTFGETLQLRVLEKVLPTIVVQSPTSGAFITNNQPTIKWTVSDEGSGINSDTISIKVDTGGAITSGITKTATTNGFSCEYTPTEVLGEGSHTLKFNVSDNDGNMATEVAITFAIDTVPPTLNVLSPVDNSYTNSTTLEVTGSTNDDTSTPVTVKVQVGSGTPQDAIVGEDGSFSITVNLSEGANTLTITATDAAGKETTITRTVTLDTGAPVFTEVVVTPNPVDAGTTYLIKAKVVDE